MQGLQYQFDNASPHTLHFTAPAPVVIDAFAAFATAHTVMVGARTVFFITFLVGTVARL
jgi:hypothetical protein